MYRLRLMTWCPSCVSGMHLPAFAAREAGLFAERGVEIEFVPAAGPSGRPAAGLTGAVGAIAAGEADLALNSVEAVLTAQTAVAERVGVRFVAVAHHRNPLVGVVREDSSMRLPRDLPGARVARWSSPGYARELACVLGDMGLRAPVLVDTPGRLDEAIGSGAIEVIPTWMDDTTRVRLQGMTLQHRGERFGLHVIPLDVPVYSTGLVAADRLPTAVIHAVRDAWVAGCQLQREHPGPGLAAFLRHFPDVSEEHARVNWGHFEPYAFDGVAPGSMSAGRWEETIAFSARAHGLPIAPGELIYRPELLAPALAASGGQAPGPG